MKPPCGNCPRRPTDSGCGNHSNCEEYLEYRKEVDALKKRKELGRKAGDFLAEATLKTMRRNGKK